MRYLHFTDGMTEAERVIKEAAQGTKTGEWTWIRVTCSASVLKFSLMGSGVSLPFMKKVLKGKAIEERVVNCKQQEPGTDSVSKRKGIYRLM